MYKEIIISIIILIGIITLDQITQKYTKESMESFFNKMENSFGFQRAYDIQKYENRMHLSFAKLTSKKPLEKIEQITSFIETSLSNEK